MASVNAINKYYLCISGWRASKPLPFLDFRAFSEAIIRRQYSLPFKHLTHFSDGKQLDWETTSIYRSYLRKHFVSSDFAEKVKQ